MIAFVFVGVSAVAATVWTPWNHIWCVLPGGVLAVLADSALRLAKRKGELGREVIVLPRKRAVFPRIFHYGFALTVPAVALCLVAALNHAPERMERGAGTFRAGTLRLITAVVLLHLGLSQRAIKR